MALIPQDPKQQRALVAIILAVGGAYAFWQYWYTPKAEDLSATEARVERLETSNRMAQIQAARGGGDLEARNALYERHVAQLERLVPVSEEVPSLINTINQVARLNRVTVSGMNPEPDVPTGVYVRQAWGLEAIGEYHNLARFITSVASLGRIITPKDFDIIPYDNAQNLREYVSPVLANFRIELYVLPVRDGGPPPAEMGTQG